MKWEPASMTNQFEYLPRNVRFSKYGMSIPIWCCLYTVFQNIRYSSKNLNVLNAVFSKQNISCFEIRWPRPIWSIDVFFMHSASASQTTCKSAFLLVLHDVLNVHACSPPPHPDSKRHVRPIKCTLTNAVIFFWQVSAEERSLWPRLHYTALHRSDAISVPDWALVYITPL